MKALPILLSAALLTACATSSGIKQTYLSGGSKADGTVVIAYDMTNWDTALGVMPTADWDTALVQATQSCRNWGYNGAQSFGAERKQCQGSSRGTFGSTCNQWQVSRTYQCTD